MNETINLCELGYYFCTGIVDNEFYIRRYDHKIEGIDTEEAIKLIAELEKFIRYKVEQDNV